jgi:hypothetical protein
LKARSPGELHPRFIPKVSALHTRSPERGFALAQTVIRLRESPPSHFALPPPGGDLIPLSKE